MSRMKKKSKYDWRYEADSEGVAAMRSADQDEIRSINLANIWYAHEKTGLIVGPGQHATLSPEDRARWETAIEEFFAEETANENGEEYWCEALVHLVFKTKASSMLEAERKFEKALWGYPTDKHERTVGLEYKVDSKFIDVKFEGSVGTSVKNGPAPNTYEDGKRLYELDAIPGRRRTTHD